MKQQAPLPAVSPGCDFLDAEWPPVWLAVCLGQSARGTWPAALWQGLSGKRLSSSQCLPTAPAASHQMLRPYEMQNCMHGCQGLSAARF